MANMSMDRLGGFMQEMLDYGNRTTSFNLYMAHGGTNFGFHAGTRCSGFVQGSVFCAGLYFVRGSVLCRTLYSSRNANALQAPTLWGPSTSPTSPRMTMTPRSVRRGTMGNRGMGGQASTR